MPNFSVSYMVSFSEKWNVLKNKETLSQKFMGTVKPDAPLKNRLDVAQKRLQQQIVKLGEKNKTLLIRSGKNVCSTISPEPNTI